MAISHMTEQIGRVLGGRYRLLSPLGSGTSADVYVADDVRLHRRVAVKLLHPALADDEEFLLRFRAEIRAIASLNHPSILAVFDWSGEEQPYLVTECLDGGSLRAMLDAGHRLSPSQVLVIGLQAAQALDVAHRQGFVHRSIKPANLLFGSDGRLRLADLGLARAVAEAALTEPAGAITGAARYASPEQARGEPLTGHSDVYSLTLVLIEAVTGQVPFASDTTFSTLTARLEQPVEVPEDMSSLRSALQRAGALAPSDRPDAAELVSELMSAATNLPRPAELPLVGATALQEDSDESADQTAVVGVQAVGNAGPSGPDSPPALVTAPQPALGPAPDTPGPPGPAPPGYPFDEPQLAPGGRHAAAPQVHPKRSAGRPLLPNWAIPTLVVLLALIVGAGGTWFLREASVPSHQVPEALIGSHISEIDTLIGDYGWRIDRTEEHADGTEEGQILRTEPEPGSQLRERGTLEVVVSLGPTLVDLPNHLEGLMLEEAEERLANAGLDSEVERQQHDTMDPGQVIGVAEGTGTQVPKGSTVTLLVSEGPSGAVIPEVTGWMWKDARRTLEDLDLDVDRREVRNPNFGRDQVVRTDPVAGTPIEPGTEVTVYVSRDDGGGPGGGGELRVPFLFGKTIGDARQEITNLGLALGTVQGSDADFVLTQDPMGGTPATSGTQVHLNAW